MQSSMVGHTADSTMVPSRGKGGRKDGGKGKSDDSKTGVQGGSRQEGQPAQKWVEVRPVEPAPAVKGQKKNQQQDHWEPKEATPKALMPAPLQVTTPALMPPPPTK